MAARKDKAINNNKRRGVSLIEVLISATLFILVWLVLVGNILVGRAGEVRSRHHVQAAYYAQSFIEEGLRPLSFSALIALKPTNPNRSNITVGGENTSTQFNATRATTILNIVKNGAADAYAEVKIDIQWNESSVLGGITPQHEYIMAIIPNDPIGN